MRSVPERAGARSKAAYKKVRDACALACRQGRHGEDLSDEALRVAEAVDVLQPNPVRERYERGMRQYLQRRQIPHEFDAQDALLGWDIARSGLF